MQWLVASFGNTALETWQNRVIKTNCFKKEKIQTWTNRYICTKLFIDLCKRECIIISVHDTWVQRLKKHDWSPHFFLSHNFTTQYVPHFFHLYSLHLFKSSFLSLFSSLSFKILFLLHLFFFLFFFHLVMQDKDSCQLLLYLLWHYPNYSCVQNAGLSFKYVNQKLHGAVPWEMTRNLWRQK